MDFGLDFSGQFFPTGQGMGLMAPMLQKNPAGQDVADEA
jgi:hypothetical protein